MYDDNDEIQRTAASNEDLQHVINQNQTHINTKRKEKNSLRIFYNRNQHKVRCRQTKFIVQSKAKLILIKVRVIAL